MRRYGSLLLVRISRSTAREGRRKIAPGDPPKPAAARSAKAGGGGEPGESVHPKESAPEAARENGPREQRLPRHLRGAGPFLHGTPGSLVPSLCSGTRSPGANLLRPSGPSVDREEAASCCPPGRRMTTTGPSRANLLNQQVHTVTHRSSREPACRTDRALSCFHKSLRRPTN